MTRSPYVAAARGQITLALMNLRLEAAERQNTMRLQAAIRVAEQALHRLAVLDTGGPYQPGSGRGYGGNDAL